MLTSLLGQRVMRDLRRDIFAHVQRLPVTFFDRNPVGRLVTRVTSDVESLNELFTAGVVAGWAISSRSSRSARLMLATDWRLALASFARDSVRLRWRRASFRSRCATRIATSGRSIARINAYLQERITGMRVVQLFGREATRRGASTR